jgi:dolichol-phosphate mannosyltransferase
MPADPRAPRVLVIIPTYNERENIQALVPAVLAHGYRAMIVDDDSPDGTGTVADQLAHEHPAAVTVLHRTADRGLGRAYLHAFARALETDADVICQMDADLSHDPDHLPTLVAATARVDLVIGSRYVQGGRVVNWPAHRSALSAFANRYVRFVLGLEVRDCTSGYRCWRREALAGLPLARVVSDGYAFLVETLHAAAVHGCRIAEVPIVFVERRVGQSKLSAGVFIESALTPWRIRTRR